MSEQDKPTPVGKHAKKEQPAERAEKAERARIRSVKDAVDELKIYGDGEDGQAARARRNEKTPARPAKKKVSKKPEVKKVAGHKSRVSWFVRIFGEANENSESGIYILGHKLTFWPIVITIAVVLLLGATFLESRNLSVSETTATIVGLANELEGYRILQLSDLNGRRFGDKQSTLLRSIDTQSYDVVFMTGDMIGPRGDPQPFYELLEGLPSRKKVFFIAGDSDPSPYANEIRAESGKLSELVLADWVLGAIERGATYVDRPIYVTVGASGYWLSPASMLNLNLYDSYSTWKEQMEQEQSGVINGIQADYNSLPFTSYRCERVQKSLESLLEMKQTDLHIALSHVPPADSFIQAVNTHASEPEKYLGQPELILAGHYCGGVWRLPILGAFYIPNSTAPRYGWFPAQNRVSGLSAIGETQMYISAGLSTCSDTPLMRFRLLNRPQISLISLTATLPMSMIEGE